MASGHRRAASSSVKRILRRLGGVKRPSLTPRHSAILVHHSGSWSSLLLWAGLLAVVWTMTFIRARRFAIWIKSPSRTVAPVETSAAAPVGARVDEHQDESSRPVGQARPEESHDYAAVVDDEAALAPTSASAPAPTIPIPSYMPRVRHGGCPDLFIPVEAAPPDTTRRPDRYWYDDELEDSDD